MSVPHSQRGSAPPGTDLPEGDERDTRMVGVTLDIPERQRAEDALRDREVWLAGQRGALEAALNSAPLATSLGVLVRTATDQLGQGVRAAFYLANPAGTALHHVVGMPTAYAEAVDGFPIGPQSLACGLATYSGRPVLTSDVTKEPGWAPWRWLAEAFAYRGCWSFPLHTAAGTFVGAFAVYWRQPREVTARDLELIALLTHTASIIIAQHQESEARQQAEATLRDLNATLEERVRERTAALEREAQRAEHFAWLGRLAAGVSHEIRNPLSAIYLHVDLVEEEMREPSPESTTMAESLTEIK